MIYYPEHDPPTEESSIWLTMDLPPDRAAEVLKLIEEYYPKQTTPWRFNRRYFDPEEMHIVAHPYSPSMQTLQSISNPWGMRVETKAFDPNLMRNPTQSNAEDMQFYGGQYSGVPSWTAPSRQGSNYWMKTDPTTMSSWTFPVRPSISSGLIDPRVKEWSTPVEIPIPAGTSMYGVITRRTQANVNMGNLRELNLNTDLSDIAQTDRTIYLTNIPRRVSLKLKSGSIGPAEVRLANSLKAKVQSGGIASISYEAHLVPHYGLSNVSESTSCPNGDSLSASPLFPNFSDDLISKLPFQDKAIIAVVDSGIAEDSRSGFRFGPRPDRPDKPSFDRRFSYYSVRNAPNGDSLRSVTIGWNFVRDSSLLADLGYGTNWLYGGHGTHVSGIATGRALAMYLQLSDEQKQRAFTSELDKRLKLFGFFSFPSG